jgi:hypothetical protein
MMSAHFDDDRDLILVTAWMQEFARQPLDSSSALDPAIVWWKAQMLRQWDAQAQASAALNTGEHVQLGLSVMACLALAAWAVSSASPLSTTPLAMGSVIIGVVLIAIVSAFSAWDRWRGDDAPPDRRPARGV